MRIAMISEHGSPLAAPGAIDSGGQNIYVAQLARQLAARGHEVDIFTRREHPSQAPCLQWGPGLRVIHVPAGPCQPVAKEGLLAHMPAFSAYTCDFVRRQPAPYDLAHANFFMSGMVAEHLQQQIGLPFAITFHALGLVRRRSQGGADRFPAERSRIEARLMQRANLVIAECAQDREDMLRLYGADAARITVLPCGFDPAELWPVRDQARRQLRLSRQEFVVLQLGRMVPRKGIDNVIEGLAVLRYEHGLQARLLIAGGAQGERAECARLAAMAKDYGIASLVSFTGPVARQALRFYYSAADVFVSTPWYEPFGITPLEAMACATPVIGAAVGGIRSTVLHGHTGLLVPPRDPHRLAVCLAQLQRQPWQARRLGSAGWRHAHRHYTWHSVAERLLAAYGRLSKESP